MTTKIEATYIELDEQGSAPSTPASGKARLYIDSKGILRWLNDDGTTGTGTLRGTSFPSSPATNDHFFRTDLGLECYYDGTRWLTKDDYTHESTFLAASANSNNAWFAPFRQDYAPYVTRIDCTTRVTTTNNGSAFWNVAFEGASGTFGATTTIWSFNTGTTPDTADAYTQHNTSAPTTQNPTNKVHFNLNVTKTSTPGNLTICFSMAYKLIVT